MVVVMMVVDGTGEAYPSSALGVTPLPPTRRAPRGQSQKAPSLLRLNACLEVTRQNNQNVTPSLVIIHSVKLAFHYLPLILYRAG